MANCNLCNLLGGRVHQGLCIHFNTQKVWQLKGPSSLETSKGTPRWWNVVISVDLSEWA